MPRILPALLAPLLFAAAVRADDTFKYDGIKYTGTIVGLQDGFLFVTVRGADHLYDLSKVQEIDIALVPAFSEAEDARADDPKKAAALYKDAIKALNQPALKQLAEFRAIEPADADGKWTDAITYFLDVYQAQPNDVVWKGRPTHMPNPPSTLLKESADKVASVIKTIKADDAREKLKGLQLEIVNKSGDVESAQRIAHELTTGTADDGSKPREADPNAATVAAIVEIEAALRDKNYDAAIAKSDALLATVTDSAAIQVFQLKARIYAEQDKPDLATATLLRIPTHYPGNLKEAPAALFQAAEMQKHADHPAAAAQLYHEIIVNYPDSKEAPLAKQAGAK